MASATALLWIWKLCHTGNKSDNGNYGKDSNYSINSIHALCEKSKYNQCFEINNWKYILSFYNIRPYGICLLVCSPVINFSPEQLSDRFVQFCVS